MIRTVSNASQQSSNSSQRKDLDETNRLKEARRLVSAYLNESNHIIKDLNDTKYTETPSGIQEKLRKEYLTIELNQQYLLQNQLSEIDAKILETSLKIQSLRELFRHP